MSVLNKIPYINSVLKDLSKANLKKLENLVNGLGNRTELFRTMDVPSGNRSNITISDKGVHVCSLQIGPTLYQGYLLYGDHYCALLAFTDFQSISILDIDVAKKEWKTISEYLDANELRSTLNDMLIEKGELVSVGVEDIDSGSEEAGKVIVSDGNGGATWGVVADKDIISQIVVEYDEEGDYTNFIFPKGIMPLSITLNTHELYLKDNDLVGNDGQEIEGYSFSEYIYLDDEDKLVLTIDGDLSEQVINNLVYICFNGKPVAILNTYNLFYPASGGTKLYKHMIDFTNTDEETFYMEIYSLSNEKIFNLTMTKINENSAKLCIWGELNDDGIFGEPATYTLIGYNSLNPSLIFIDALKSVVNFSQGDISSYTIDETVTEL